VSFPALVLAGFFALSAWAVALYLLRDDKRRAFVPFLRSVEVSGQSRVRERWARRLRHPLSLLFLLLLLAALGWALLRRGLETAEPRLLSLVVDVSRNMEPPASGTSGPTRLDLARSKAEQYLKNLSVGQEAMLIEAGGHAELRVPPTTDLQRISRELQALRSLDTEAALAAGLKLSEAVAGDRQLEVVLFTQGEVSAKPRSSTALSVVQVGVAAQPANVAIRSFSARRYPLGAGQFEAVVVVQSSATERTLVRATLLAVDLSSGQRSPIDVAEFELEAGSERRFAFRTEAGVVRALECQVEWVDGQPEPSVRDNVGRALLPEERPLKILVVGKESLFLTAALLASGRVELTHLAAAQYPPLSPAGHALDFDLTVFRELPPKREARTGPAVYFAQAGPGQAGAALPVALGKRLKMFGFDESDRKSKLFRFFDPFDTQILNGAALVPQGSDRVLASSGGLPLVVSGERTEGRFVASGFVPEDSDMVLRSAFPLFIRGLLEELLGEVSQEWIEPSLAGEPLHVSFPGARPVVDMGSPAGSGAASASANGPGSVQLRGPLFEADENVRKLQLNGSGLEFEPTRAGFYELRAAELPPRYVAVNSRPLAFASTTKSSPPERALASPTPKPGPTWIGWVLAVLGLSLFEYYSYHRRWTV